jgi:hypothetical protein
MSERSNRLKQVLSKVMIRQYSEKDYNLKNINEFLTKSKKLEDHSFDLVPQITELEKIYETNRKQLFDLKRKELDRIAKEFLLNDYARRYNVTYRVLVTAIAGEDMAAIELKKHKRELKVILN